MTAVAVYTDGACSGNPGPGGWAWATKDGRSGTGGEPTTTNQRMELQAVLEALRELPGPVVVHSDSTYVVNCFNDRWYEGWVAKNWRNSQRKPVANRDLWEPLVELFVERGDDLSFVWVKGHSGDVMNDLVDQLAVAESHRQRDMLNGGGSGTPAAAADAATSTTGSDQSGSGPIVPWPAEQAIVATGVAEPDDEQIEGLTSAVDGLTPGYDLLISGLRRGAELTAAELAVARGITIGVVLPYDNPAVRWPQPLRERFDACLAAAEWVVTLDGDPRSPSKAVAARNRWLWAAAVGAIIVGDDGLVEELDAFGLGVVPVP
jgi:ribonuclease HI